MNIYSQVIDTAIKRVVAEHPRARYPIAVLRGAQAWSGNDLIGIAKKYGASYARTRQYATEALLASGGVLVYFGRFGRLTAAVPTGQDDFGSAIYCVEGGAGVVNASGKRVDRIEEAR